MCWRFLAVLLLASTGIAHAQSDLDYQDGNLKGLTSTRIVVWIDVKADTCGVNRSSVESLFRAIVTSHTKIAEIPNAFPPKGSMLSLDVRSVKLQGVCAFHFDVSLSETAKATINGSAGDRYQSIILWSETRMVGSSVEDSNRIVAVNTEEIAKSFADRWRKVNMQ